MASKSPDESLNEACDADQLAAEIARLSDNLGECEHQIASLMLVLTLMRNAASERGAARASEHSEAKRA
jgi:hypothetical protein